MSKAKFNYYTKTNHKNLWNSFNCLLYKQTSSPLPVRTDTTALANSFSTFLNDKIAKITVVFQDGQNGHDSEDNVNN